MLYLHLGMPKTGTSSLQRLLDSNPEALAGQGYLYPRAWRGARGVGHHELGTALVARGDPQKLNELLRRVTRRIERWGGRDVIISTESLSRALSIQRLPPLNALLETCASGTETKALLVLRRMDAQIESMYAHQLKIGRREEISVDDYATSRMNWIGATFAGISALRAADERWSFELLKYTENEDCLPAVLAAMGLDPGVFEVPERRRGSRLGRKAQSMLTFPDGKLDQLGVSRRRLIGIFESQRFEFADETYDYDVLGLRNREVLHRHALAKAREFGVDEYERFFGEDEIDGGADVALSRDLVSDEDLRDLQEFLSARARVKPSPEAAGLP